MTAQGLEADVLVAQLHPGIVLAVRRDAGISASSAAEVGVCVYAPAPVMYTYCAGRGGKTIGKGCTESIKKRA